MHDATNTATRRADAAMLADVRTGLAKPQKELPPKYFYDRRGSVLFEEITRLPEYYLTRTERALLTRVVPEFADAARPATLVELGAGSAEKTRIVLDAMRAARPDDQLAYVPVDISAAFLAETADRVRADYPGLSVVPVVADITDDAGALRAPRTVPRPVMVAFLGSTIGNLEDDQAVQLLRRVRAGMRAPDRLLLGADLRKDPAVIEAAYNDAAGVTAEFNRNMLKVIDRELGATFDPQAFTHRAFFDPTAGRIEMHLVSKTDQCVSIPGIGSVFFPRGDSIRTEISNKYDKSRLTEILAAADLDVVRWETDARRGYVVLLAAPCA
jgi:L-histidine N-alpha-methyltransferase